MQELTAAGTITHLLCIWPESFGMFAE